MVAERLEPKQLLLFRRLPGGKAKRAARAEGTQVTGPDGKTFVAIFQCSKCDHRGGLDDFGLRNMNGTLRLNPQCVTCRGSGPEQRARQKQRRARTKVLQLVPASAEQP